MERIAINPARLRWCLDDRGVTPEELGAKFKIAEKTLADALAGAPGLTVGQLQKLAKFFHRRLLFFIHEGPVDEVGLRSPQFRTLANQKPDLEPEVRTLIERAEAARRVYLGLLEDAAEEDAVGRFDPPTGRGGRPVEAAAAVRAWLGLEAKNDFATTRRRVEDQGVLVLMGVGYFGDWRLSPASTIAGFSLFHEVCPVILVKKHPADGRQLFTLAHELGHLVLHRGSFVDDDDDLRSRRGREREANLFAAHLLVPDDQLAGVDDASRPEDAAELHGWLRAHARRWGVSVEVILLRLLDAGRLPRAAYDGYLGWRGSLPATQREGGNRGFRHREPLHLFGERYVRTVLDAYHSREITLNKASGFLDNLKVADLHQLEAHLASV